MSCGGESVGVLRFVSVRGVLRVRCVFLKEGSLPVPE
jgi:hypothetical protein